MSTNARQGYAWLPIIGVFVGWLMGISVSPVVQTVIGALIASAAAIVGTMAGISVKTAPAEPEGNGAEKAAERPLSGVDVHIIDPKPPFINERLRVDPLPLALLLAGMFLGTVVGIYARTNNWLGPNPKRVVAEWSSAGIPEAEIRKRLFDQIYPPESNNAVLTKSKTESEGSKEKKPTEAESTPSPAARASVAALFSVSAEDCNILAGRTGNDLQSRLLLLHRPDSDAGVKACARDEICLQAVREVICSISK